MLHISEFRVQKYADKGGFPLSLNFTQFTHLYLSGLTCVNKLKFKIMNERLVINIKVERKQRRTGLSFRGLFFSFLLCILTCIRTS